MGGVRYGIPDLAAIRGSRGVSLRQIADATRIGMFYLRAIEGGDIDKLPPGIYARSYVRQYARAIEYDEQELLRQLDLMPEVEVEMEEMPLPAGGWFSRILQMLNPMLRSRTEDSR